MAIPGLALGLWLVFGSLYDLSQRMALFKVPLAASFARAGGLPRAALGMLSAHAGLGITVIGVVAMSLWRSELILSMKPGDRADIAGYSVEFLGEKQAAGPNYDALAGSFRVYRGNSELAELVSEKRTFKPSGMPTTEVGLLQKLSGDVYIAMGDTSADGGRVVRLYVNPLVNMIWLGGLFMFIGGLLSLSDRRYRIGAPKTNLKLQQAAAE